MYVKASQHAVELQNRDIVLLNELFLSRALTYRQIAVLCFDENEAAARKRLLKLKWAGLVVNSRSAVFDKAVFSISKGGLIALQMRGMIPEQPRITIAKLITRAKVGDQNLIHELSVIDIKVAFTRALAKQACFSPLEFSTWPDLHQFRIHPNLALPQRDVKPDAFIRVREIQHSGTHKEHFFFAEMDRSTEPLHKLVPRLLAYAAYFRSGLFAQRNGAKREDYQHFPFRVLVVVKSEQRMKNLLRALLESFPRIYTQVWISTIDKVTQDPLGQIWLCPVDSREFDKTPKRQKTIANELDEKPSMRALFTNIESKFYKKATR